MHKPHRKLDKWKKFKLLLLKKYSVFYGMGVFHFGPVGKIIHRVSNEQCISVRIIDDIDGKWSKGGVCTYQHDK